MKNWFRAATALAASAALWVRPVLAAELPGAVPQSGGTSIQDLVDLIGTIIDWMLLIAGVLAVAYLVYAGIQYIVGGPKADELAKKQIVNAITGIVIIILSYVIVNAIFALGR